MDEAVAASMSLRMDGPLFNFVDGLSSIAGG